MVLSSEAERKEIARRHLDSAETWLRSIIEYRLSVAYGKEYFGATLASGKPVIPKRIREQATARRAGDPLRFSRDVDATMLDEVIDIALHPELHSLFFREPLQMAYPDGVEEARTFLERLRGHRNRLSHGGTCSHRDLEQCTCYANDLIDSLKAFFLEKQMARVFNVPTFTRVVDTRGNDFRLTVPGDSAGHFVDVRERGKGDLYPGDVLGIEVEVDESFASNEWSIRWITFSGDSEIGLPFELNIGMKHVGEQMDVRFEVISNKEWHRLFGGCDDRLDLRYRVLPPRS